jgi:8-oxo-dGTP pyrophosphatase MutT (NUDIX family)
MKMERSAGVIVFRDDPSGRVYLLLDYGKHWDYPKGHVEKNEDDLSAARRELEEETGIRDAEILPGFSREMQYFFRAKGQLIRKTVIFFLARTDRQRVRLSDEHEGSEFLPYEAAMKRLTYSNAKQILRAANDFLNAAD